MPQNADIRVVEQLTKPLFRFDPGWLFVMAGVVICAAGVVLPAQNDLEALRLQLDQLRAQETLAYDRLKAHGDFLDQVDRSDPALVRRLAATQLNMVPEGDTPILLARADGSPVTDWIEGTVQKDLRPPRVVGVSTLSRLANGPYRLWVFGGGILSVFIGLMLAPTPAMYKKRRAAVWIESKPGVDELTDEGDEVGIDDGDEAPQARQSRFASPSKRAGVLSEVKSVATSAEAPVPVAAPAEPSGATDELASTIAQPEATADTAAMSGPALEEEPQTERDKKDDEVIAQLNAEDSTIDTGHFESESHGSLKIVDHEDHERLASDEVDEAAEWDEGRGYELRSDSLDDRDVPPADLDHDDQDAESDEDGKHGDEDDGDAPFDPPRYG